MRKQYFSTVLKSILFVAFAALQSFSASATCNANIDQLVIHNLGNNSNTAIVDGATYSLGSLPTNWNVEAIVSGTTVGSVKLTWSGDYSNTNTENTYPYRTPTDEVALNLGVGSYTVNVKIYKESGCGGFLCDEETYHFTISGCDNVTSAGSIGNAQTGCSPFNPSAITSVAHPSGGSGALEYVWLSSTNGGTNYTVISGATASTYDPGSLTTSTWFRRCSRRAGCTDYVGESNWLKMTVSGNCCDNVTNAGSIGNAQTGCSPFNPSTITSVALPSGGSGTLEYVWLSSTNGGTNYTVISGATASTYDPGSLTTSTWFRRCSRRAGCTDYVGESNWLKMTVSGNCCDNVTNAGSIGNAQTGCSPFNPSAITSVALPSGGSGTLEYVWLSSTNGGTNYTVISGATASTYDPGSLTTSTWFRRCSRRAGCTDYIGESNWLKMTVSGNCCDNVTDAGEIGSPQTGCSPFDPAEIVSIQDPSGGTGDLEFVWLKSTNGGSNYTAISGASGLTYDPGVITQTTWYRRCSRRAGCTDYVGESNWLKMTVGTTGVSVNISKTDVSCNSDNSHECDAVHYQNGSHAVWINTLPGTSTNFKFENNSGNLVEYPDGTASVSGVIYNTSEPNKRWQVDVKLNDKKTWSQWQAAGGSWKGTSSIVGNNYQDWAYYEMDASNSRMIGLGDYAGKELSLQRMSAAPQFRVQVGTAANDKNGNYGFSLWFDYSGDYSGHGDFNFDLQNCVDHGCDGTATATASGGTAPYTYIWDNGMTTSSLDGLCAGQYCVSVVDATGCTSDEACVTVGDKPSCCNVTDPGAIAGGGSGCAPYDPTLINSTELPSGGTGNLEYVWLVSSNGGNNYTVIQGANGPSYDPGAITQTTWYRRCARRSGCTDYVGESNWVQVVVTGPCCDNVTNPGSIAEDQTHCGPFDVAELTSIAAPTGGSGALEIVWITRPGTSGAWQMIAGADGLTYDPGVVSVTTQFRRCARRAGCTDYVGESNIITITIVSGPTATCSKVDGTCLNNNLGSASVSVSGGTAPYTYLWSTGATTVSISNLTAGSYSVTVTDVNGCTATCSTAVSITPCCNVTNGGQIAGGGSNCGPFDPAAITSASLPTGGLGELEYVWLWNTQNVVNNGNSGWVEIPNSNSATYDPGLLTETRCFLRCARRSGCTTYVGESNIICYTVNPAPVATCSKVDGSCSNNNQASASVSVSNGSEPYTYLWSTGATTVSISNLTAGSYSVTVTDVNGCTATCSTSVSITPCCNVTDPGEIASNGSDCAPFDPPTITSVQDPSGGIGTLEIVWITRTGTSGPWTEISGANGLTYNPGVITTTTQYRRCARRSGCADYVGESNIITMTVTGPCCDNVTNGGIIAENQSNCGPFDPALLTSVSLPSGGSGVIEYVWLISTNGGANYTTIAGANGPTYDPGTVSVTTWFRRCARRAGCVPYVGESNWVQITVNPNDIVATCTPTNGTCSNNNAASASVSATGGTAPYTYLWSTGATTVSISNLTAGSYSVTVTDVNGCTATCSTSVSITPCCNVTNGGQIAGGGSNCGPFDPAAITSASLPTGGLGDLEYVWLWNTQNVVNNGNSGWVEIPNSNSATYDPGLLTETRCFLRCARRSGCTTYVGESNIVCYTINPAPVATCSKVDGSCSNNNEASASVSVSSGTSPFTYAWSNGGTTASINGLAAGTYSVIVTDANGCSDDCSVTVTNTPCCNVTNGGQIAGGGSNCGPFDPAAITSASLPTGGLGDLEYVWLWNTQNVVNNGNSGWVEIPNSNSATYDPGLLTETRCFLRCARRSGCTTYVGESNIICFTVNPTIDATASATDVTCDGDNSHECEAVHYQNGSHAVWINTLPGTSTDFKFENNSGNLVEYPDGTARVTGIVYNTSNSSKRWQVDVYLNDKKDWTQWQAAGGSWKGTSSIVGNNYQDWAYYEMDASQSRMIGLGTYAGKELSLQRMAAAPQFRVQVGTAANDKNANYGFSLWFDYSGDYSGHGDFNFDLQNCADHQCNGTATASATGGQSPYTYLWDNGATTASVDGLCAGQYCVTVVDASGCEDQACVTVGDRPVCCDVTEPGSVAGSQENCGAFDPVAFTSVAPATGGSGDIQYQWYSKETETSWTPIPGATSASYDPGMTSVNIQFKRCARRSGCPEYQVCSNVLDITIYSNNIIATCSQSPAACAGASTGSASVAVQGGTAPYTYSWSNGGTSASVNGLAAGTYSVTVTDHNGCTGNCSVVVGEANTLTANCTPTNGTCSNNNLGSATVTASGGTSPFTYVWSNGATSSAISNLTAGSYSVTVTDANGCTATCSTSVSITPCCNVTNGGQIAGGGSNCGPFDPAAITSASSPTGGLGDLEYVWLWNTQNVVNNGNSGWVEIPNSNSATYDPGLLTETRCFLRCARRSGCTEYIGESNIICYTVNPEPVATCSKVDGSCSNNNEASASVSVSGGTAPFTYAWSNGGTTASINGLAAGTYSATVTDANGCSDDCSVTVSVTPCCNVTDPGQIAASQENCGGFDPERFTSVSLPSGGLGDLEYVWLVRTIGGAWSEIPNSDTPEYDAPYTDVSLQYRRCARRSGCTAYIGESNILTVTVNPEPVATCSSVNGTCNNNNQASASVSVSGGTSPFTYAWSNGGTTASINGLAAGSYSVTVTDANGCSDDCSVTVAITPCCNVTNGGQIAGGGSNCGPFDPAAITSASLPTGGLGDLEYVWLWNANNLPLNNGQNGWVEIPNSNSATYDPGLLTETRCFLRCARRSGCTTYVGESNIVCYTVNPAPVATCSKVDGSCSNNNEASASVSVSSGTSPFSYAWSNGGTTASINGLAAGSYSVTVTDANGCSATCSTSVSITPCCNVTNGGTIAGVQENCGPFDPERITSVAPANGGLGGLEYVWLWNANNLPLNNGQNGWVEIPNSNTETYDPGYLTESRCFLRCARRSGCTTYVGESNVICVTVNPDDMVATCTAIDADCNGASTGSASVSTTGGTAPYTVLWSTGATTVSISNLMAGSYSVTVTDANGCTTTCSTTVNEPSDLTATCSKVDGSCSNNNQASVSVSAAGGTAPYSYVWSNGATGSSISGLAAGTYSVTVTDSKGCTESCDKTVNITPCCNVTNGGTIAGVQENCGPFDPAAFTSTSLPTGGLGDLEYVWLSNPNNVPINNGNNGWVEIPNSNSATYDPGMVTATTCYLRCARRSGCTDYVGESNVICVTVNPIPVATCVPTNGTCANDNVASASVSVTGGTAPYSYAWSNGGTTASISNLADGTYSVTVTDVNGCSDDCSVTVSTIPCCDVTDPGTVAGSQEGCGPFDPVAFTSIAPATGGLENIVYQWYQKETETTWMPIPGANGETYDPGMISINSQFKRCARREGCPEFTFCSDILEIEIHPVPQVNCTSISGNCSNGNGASATVNVQGATSPYTFAWSNGETTQTIGNLAEGNYSVIVTDYFGCTADCNVNVTVAGCCNVTNGGTIAGVQENCGPFDPAAITSVAPATGGLGDLEYLWLWNSQNVPVNNGNNGWVEIPNSDNETYDPGMLTESRCFIRCARRSGCDIYIGESNVICITVNPVPVANCTPTNGDCNNNNSASASVSVTGGTSPFSYAWSNGGTTASISGLAAGTYSVTVTDANGCTDDCSVTVSTNPCCDVTDPGTVAGSQEGCGPFDPVAFTSVAPAAGGLGGIEYQWYQKETETTWTPIPGATSETYDPGMISINSQFKRCARREGCPEFTFCSDILEITINPVPTVTCTEVDGNCNNGNLGSVSVSVQGGTGPYTYLWSNNETTASISGLAAGTYSVTVTDQNSCEANCSKIVEVTPCCNVTSGGQIAGAQENCGPFDPVAFTSTSLPAGGLGDLEYVWLTNSQNVPLNNGNNGWVEIPNSNSATYDPGMITETTCFIRCARRDGCTIYPGESNVICVTINENPVASCSSTDSGCNGAGTGTASVSVTGGEAPYTYAWSNGGTTAIISGLTAGTYSVTVTDANGCTDDCTATVGQPSGLSVTCSATDVDCNGNATGTATANPTGGTLPYSYAWSNGGTTASISGLAAGAYDLTITDANGCTATCSSTVSENDALTADATSTNPVCNGATTGTAEVAVGGGDGVYTYAWSNGETTASVSGLAAGAYSVVVTDGNGCEETANVSITEPSELIATCTPVNGDCSNGNAASASVAIDGGVEPYTVLWSTGASTLSINNLQAGSYDLTVTDANGCEVTCTAVVTVTPCCNVTDPGEIAASQDSCGPFNPAPIVSLAPATGGIGPVEYVWLQGNCSTNPNTWAQIPGANGESYDPGMLTETTCFRRCARNQGCTDYIGESNIITITVGPGCCDNVTNGGEIATSQENCGPFDPAVFTSVADPTGGSGNLEYVWLWNSQNVPINNGNNGWVEIPNSNSATYDPGMMTETTCFIRCARRSGCVPYIGESNVICITINPGDLSADCTPVNGNCANGNAASASVNATGGEAPYSYAWSNGGTTASIDNLATGSYSVTVTDANGCTAVCTTAVEVVGCCNVTEPGSIAANQENCGPFDVAELTSVVDPSGGLGALEIVWITRTGTSGPWQEISGAHGLTFDPGIVAATTQFRRCVRRNGCNEFEESNIITITIFPQPEVVCNPTHGDCSNNGMGSVSTSITGGTAPFSYAWSTSTGSAQANGATVADISNLGAGTYSVVVTDANGCATDCSVTITSEPCCNVTDGGEIAGTQENCGPFDPTAITSVVPATGGIGPVEYVWLWNTQNVPNYGNNGWVEIPNSNSDSYDPGYLTESRCFLRCARNVGCTTYIGESNVVCVTVNPVPEVLCTKDDGDCTNDNVASIYAAASAGTEPYTYLWSNGETTSSITNLVAGTYSVTATDANGCEATCSKTVSITPCCNVTDGGQIAASQENCGPFDPAAITSVSPPTGGLGDLEYVWLMNHENVPLNNGNNGWVEIPNSDNESYDPGILTETTCFIRCARRSGCTVYVGESNVVCVTINEAPVATCTPINGDCNNGNIASASVSASGGTEPYSYEWSNGETTASINDIAAGTYSVTVTDANGCTADCSVTVSITPCCNVTNGGEIAGAQENCGPFDPAAITSLTPATGGLGDLEYVWLMNDQNVPLNNGNNGWVEIPNSNSDSYDPGMLTETTCFIRCARRSGCTVYVGESNVVCITVNPALEVECSSVSGDCGNGNVGSASVDVTSGTAPFTYEWSNGGTTASIENLGAGTYTVTVTDANGCMGTCTEEVIVTPCCNVTDPGEIAGTQQNCTAFDPDPITSVAPATGGIGPVEYMWLQGDCNTDPNTWTPISGADGASYDPGMLTETTCFRRCARNNGCEPWVGESNIITITIQNALTIECSSISGDCGNGNVASASVDVIDGVGPYTYEWSNGETTASITGLAEGTYTVTVTDANGCTASCTESVIVTPCCNVTDPGEIAGEQSNCGPFDPTAITSVAPATGGIGPVEYMWLQGDCNTDPNTWTPISGADGASYDPGMLTETTCFRRCARNNGCEPWIGETNIITITVYPAVELTCNGVDGDCTNGNVARAIAHISGGVEPYTIAWSNGGTTATIDSLQAGTYTVTVTDANGCEATCTTSVSVTPCCNVTDGGEIAEDQENCGAFDPNPIVSITPATGGIGPVEYAWYSGHCDEQTNPTAIPVGFSLIVGATGESYDPGMISETTCFIRVARNQGCEEWLGESNMVTITVNSAPALVCSSVDGTCENGNVGSASVTVSGSSSPFSYAWSNGATSASIENLAAGTYTVVVTDGNGCVDSCSTLVEVLPCCNVTDGGEIDGEQQNCGPFDPSEIVSITPATGGIGPVEYAWYSGQCDEQTNPTAIPVGFSLIAGATGESYDPGMLSETTCFIRVARNQGCTDWLGESNIVTITINSAPSLVCSSVDGTCENGNVGSASVNVSGAPSPFSYAWSTGATTASLENLAAGTYTVVVTDGNGCVDSCSTDVEIVPCCNVTHGGEIDGEQENCGPFDPSVITSIVPATGGIGPVVYAWYSGPCSTNSQTIGAPVQEAIPAGFTLIAGADGESYDPGMLSETTCYIRVARNQGCTDWIGESNIITITVNEVPTVDVAITGGVNPTCNGGSVELTATSSTAASYEWSTGETTATISVTETGVFVVTVADGNDCSAVDSIAIEVLPNPEVEIEVAGGNPFCNGDSTQLTANCATAVGYSWSTGATGTSIWVTEAGTYSVEVADSNGCMASTSIEVEVYELPEVEITIDGNNPLCTGDSAMLTAVSQGAISYDWSTGETTQSIWVYAADSYSVTVVNQVGCENSASYEVEEGLTPTIQITGDTVACAGGSIELTAQSTGGESILWSTGATTPSITVTEAGEYCVYTTSVDGCESSDCISIDFNPTPEVVVEVTAGSNPLCPGSEVELTATSATAVDYTWTPSGSGASITVNAAGIYSVEVTDVNGCSASATIEVEEGVVPTVVINGETEFCSGDSVMLTAQTVNGESLTWSTGETTPSIWVSEAGEYCVMTASVDGCEASVCIDIEEAAIPEVFAGNDVDICVGQSTTLTATGGTSGTIYIWYVDGEAIDTAQTIVVAPGLGITEYSVVAINENCSITDEDHVKVWVYDYPVVGFERDPAGDVPFGSDIQFTDTTAGQVTDWMWNFGDGMTSMLQNPDHNYGDPGSYWVTLIASNHGCEDTAVAGLEVKIIIDIPNVFTPNNDGVNDVIWLQGTDLENINMTIYNRWGFSVYASEGRQFSWSGKTSAGEDCEGGTYYYVIQMEYKDGNVSEQTGFFTLIR